MVLLNPEGGRESRPRRRRWRARVFQPCLPRSPNGSRDRAANRLRDDFRRSISARHDRPPHHCARTLQSGAGRIFELFVITSLARGLRNAGFSVWLQRSDGTTIQSGDADRRFIQRGGAPTGVPAASAGLDNASVIGFQKRRRQRWEIWNGNQFAGRRSAAHEIDISIVPGSVETAIRATGGIPIGRPRVKIECKDVGTAGSLDEMRAFIARLYD